MHYEGGGIDAPNDPSTWVSVDVDPIPSLVVGSILVKQRCKDVDLMSSLCQVLGQL